MAQIPTDAVLTYDFNEHEIKEKNNRVETRSIGTVLTYDRFGNAQSAVQTVGSNQSYLNLGVSPLLKSPDMSISLWVNINNRIYAGKGYDFIPILGTKNGPGFDFINGFTIAYDCPSLRLSFNSTRDSLEENILHYHDTLLFNRWYHLVAVCNNDFFAFYVNGRLTGKIPKSFQTRFLETDSMMIGHSASTKNLRFMRGLVDDIRIFHRPLSDAEVSALYNEPNPDDLQKTLKLIYQFAAVVAGLIAVIVLLIFRNRRMLKKQKEELELVNRISSLELKAVKAQMNPHFISNCLAAIQELNYNADREKAGQYIAKFSLYLRQVLNYSDENYISAEDEIDLIKLFVELEQLRFNSGFVFRLETDAKIGLKDTWVPSLITQPFIENAIWHGLLPLRNIRHPELIVSFRRINGYPVIRIEDNGVGRDATARLNKHSKGTRLALDKIETLNRLSENANYKISIVDLKDEQGKPRGTQVNIYLDNAEE